MATIRNGVLVERFNLCCHPPTSTTDVMGQQNKIGGITFGAALMFLLPMGRLVGALVWHSQADTAQQAGVSESFCVS